MNETYVEKTKTTEFHQTVETAKELSPKLKEVLKLFESYGYATDKGTNSFVLANIMVDYYERMAQERQALTDKFNFWSSDSLVVVALLAYERFRIYNLRHKPNIYDGVRDCDEYRMTGNFEIQKKLKIPYESLMQDSIVEVNGLKLNESFMDFNGAYVEMDYQILPDFSGDTLIQFNDKTLEGKLSVILYKEPKNPKNPKNHKDIEYGYRVDVDFVRFLVTELFSKFALLNRMNVKNLKRFLSLKYQKEFLVEEGLIVSPLDNKTNQEIEVFANQNVISKKKFEVKLAKKVKFKHKESIKIEPKIVKTQDAQALIEFCVDEFYKKKYGFKYKEFVDYGEANLNVKSEYVYFD